ncbi:hypothetical protein [Rathayibacter soli]|uniref:hypothetical protein n=1 Tax=Rathayibacter soli TaxID=3144168 RepID=UPI0027E42D36|nr:hypothetical protein [Glaciibacter superstes]
MNEEERLEALRRMSKSAFGQSYRLELMLSIADSEDGFCTLTNLSKTLDVTMSSLQRPFQALVELQLLSPMPDADSKYHHFVRNPSAAWDWAQELARSVDFASEIDTLESRKNES